MVSAMSTAQPDSNFMLLPSRLELHHPNFLYIKAHPFLHVNHHSFFPPPQPPAAEVQQLSRRSLLGETLMLSQQVYQGVEPSVPRLSV